MRTVVETSAIDSPVWRRRGFRSFRAEWTRRESSSGTKSALPIGVRKVHGDFREAVTALPEFDLDRGLNGNRRIRFTPLAIPEMGSVLTPKTPTGLSANLWNGGSAKARLNTRIGYHGHRAALIVDTIADHPIAAVEDRTAGVQNLCDRGVQPLIERRCAEWIL